MATRRRRRLTVPNDSSNSSLVQNYQRYSSSKDYNIEADNYLDNISLWGWRQEQDFGTNFGCLGRVWLDHSSLLEYTHYIYR